MMVRPAVIVHGLADATRVMAEGMPVTLLSAPGAALFGGCLWWRELIRNVRAAHPGTEAVDILDCADASGMALAALRSNVDRLVLWPEAPNWTAVARIASQQGGFILARAPPALDMATSNSVRRLHDWLRDPRPGQAVSAGDRKPGLG